LDYHQKCIEIWTSTNQKDGLASVFNNVSHIYLRKKDYKTAANYATKSLNTALEIDNVSSIMNAEGVLYKTDSAFGDFRGALLHHMKYIRFRDSINNTETRNAAVRKQMEYDFDKEKAIAAAEHRKELESREEIANEKSRKQAAITWSVGAGLLIVFAFAIYIFRSLRLTRKQKNIIELKNLETERQKLIIEEKNKDILDSLHYARRIQSSLLPNEKYLNKSLSRLAKN
jgi:hypothetical protein